MYAVTPAVRNAWYALFDWIARHADVPLVCIEHAAPAPLEELWSRGDLGATFMCGFPFASAAPRPLLVAAPIVSPPRYRGQPVYCTDFIVLAVSGFARLTDTFGSRIGWTASHSQSGFNAVRHHLLQYRHGRSERLFAASVGPLVTPRRVIEAVLEGMIDVGPLDSYAHDLLTARTWDGVEVADNRIDFIDAYSAIDRLSVDAAGHNRSAATRVAGFSRRSRCGGDSQGIAARRLRAARCWGVRPIFGSSPGGDGGGLSGSELATDASSRRSDGKCGLRTVVARQPRRDN
jgi:hypothetical protein